MRILGLVLEANPFHNGHKFFIESAKQLVKPDLCICVTSTSFNMRGEISLLNKFSKTKILLEHGIDIVLELPVNYFLHSANNFSEAAISILNTIGITDLAFGCEVTSIDKLTSYLNIIESKSFSEEFSKNKCLKLSYKESFSEALLKFLPPNDIDLFNLPNLTLGLQYLKQIKSINPNISVHIIEREGSSHHSLTTDNHLASGKAIRQKIRLNHSVEKFCPHQTVSHLVDLKMAENNFLILIRNKYLQNFNNLNSIFGNEEGINNYIQKNGDFSSLAKLQDSLKSKRYSINRINRMLLYACLNITKMPSIEPYLRILGINRLGLEYLQTLPKETKTLIFANYKERTKQNNQTISIVETEMELTKLYGNITNDYHLYLEEFKLPIRKEES